MVPNGTPLPADVVIHIKGMEHTEPIMADDYATKNDPPEDDPQEDPEFPHDEAYPVHPGDDIEIISDVEGNDAGVVLVEEIVGNAEADDLLDPQMMDALDNKFFLQQAISIEWYHRIQVPLVDCYHLCMFAGIREHTR
jgi:hypothetical protein